jgi:mono/diheme cytochrome c family protein
MRAIPLSARTLLAIAATIAAILPAQAQSAAHSSSEPTLSTGRGFSQTGGAELFRNICQGCHMPDGQGAVGAGAYPAIADNRNLAAREYPVHVVLHGLRAMPPFGAMLSDQQVAAVVNYLRSHLGNEYSDAVSADEVRLARP